MSKVLSNRLKVVLHAIIHPDQTCSVPGRSIIDNLHLLRDITDYTRTKNIPAALISLDQAKAFDRVSHDYLFQVLHRLVLVNHLLIGFVFVMLDVPVN